jgi:hypothetical protein
MFTPLFAIGRLPGWLAHWREMQYDPQTKIGRPQQLYVGAGERNYPGPSDRRGIRYPRARRAGRSARVEPCRVCSFVVLLRASPTAR